MCYNNPFLRQVLGNSHSVKLKTAVRLNLLKSYEVFKKKFDVIHAAVQTQAQGALGQD